MRRLRLVLVLAGAAVLYRFVSPRPAPAAAMMQEMAQVYRAALGPRPQTARERALATPGLTATDRAWIAAHWPAGGAADLDRDGSSAYGALHG